MLVGPISSSLFTVASKTNRVRVGYEKDWFCARLLFRARSCFHAKSLLSGTNIPPPISTNPIYLRATGGRHHPVLGLLPLGMRANLRGSTYSPGVRALAC